MNLQVSANKVLIPYPPLSPHKYNPVKTFKVLLWYFHTVILQALTLATLNIMEEEGRALFGV